MISKQSKGHRERPVPKINQQAEVDRDFDETVDHEANLHAPQIDDFQTMEPMEEKSQEPLSQSNIKNQSIDEITVDDISYMLSRHPEIDTSDILIRVDKGEVVLLGTVPEERMKFMVGEVIKLIHGVKSVSNQLKQSVSLR